MHHTLVAVFDNRGDAQGAMDELLASGFSSHEVRLSLADGTGQTDSLTGAAPADLAQAEPEHLSLGESIRVFFRDIFGTDNGPHVQKYSDAVSRGHHVLTVNAADEPEVERAADIVERHGPVDIDEKAAEWAGGAPIAHAESMRMSGAGGIQQSQGHSLQFEGDRNLFQQQSLNEGAPMGTTYQEPMDINTDLNAYEGRTGAPMQGSSLEGSARQDSMSGAAASAGSLQRDTGIGGATPPAQQPRGGVRVYPRDAGAAGSSWKDDQSYYRNHWNANYAGTGGLYDEYAPAYGYGAEMARDAKYRDRPWNEVESDLRSDWEKRDTTGESSWERFKAAIRHGWDRMTS